MSVQSSSGIKRFLKANTEVLVGKLNEAKQVYVNFVGNNPEMTDQIERTVKAAAYLYEAFSKNYDNSIFITELVSSACNLFVYVNHHIRKTKDFFTLKDGDNFADKLKQVLTVIEFSQAFIEMTAARSGGPGARWAVISVICLVKVILRCVLLLIFQSGIHVSSLSQLSSPAVVASGSPDQSPDSESNVFYVGPRSGKKIRTIDGSDMRPCPKVGSNLPTTVLDKHQIIGELLFSLRPMLHLIGTGAFGTKSYVPWVVALIADASSHALLHKKKTSKKENFNPIEAKELQRRYANLLLYLLRSPLYETTTGPRLLRLFAYLTKKVPLAHYVFEPLTHYLPVWQKVYFYTWAD